MEHKPQNVKIAVKLLYAALILGVINGIIFFYQMANSNLSDLTQGAAGQTFNPIPAVIIMVVIVVFYAFLIFKIHQGRNWARITYTVLLAIGVLGWLFGLRYLSQTDMVTFIINTIQLVLSIIGVILLFKRNSSDWFKSKN